MSLFKTFSKNSTEDRTKVNKLRCRKRTGKTLVVYTDSLEVLCVKCGQKNICA